MNAPATRSHTVVDITRRVLEREFTFDDVVAESRTGQYGDQYFQVYVLYDSKKHTPSPETMVSLYRKMRPELLEHGIECLIGHSYADISEDGPWSDLLASRDQADHSP